MIIKYGNSLYNIDGWKTIKLEDGFCVITFSDTVKIEDEDETYEINIGLVDDDYMYDFKWEHEEYDHKDLRQVQYIAEDAIYNIILKEVVRETPYIDFDKIIDVPKILKKASKDYEEE